MGTAWARRRFSVARCRGCASGHEPRLTILDGYIRISQVAGRSGPRFISPLVQRQQIEGWAQLHGRRVGEIFEELDQSGGRADRPLLLRAIDRIEAGQSQGLVVAKLDRFGRSLSHGLAAIERITQAGGTVVSVSDGLDSSSDTGRLVLRLMLSLAEHELDRVRTVWATARAQAISRGVHIGPAPFGYRRKPDGGLSVDRRAAPLIEELFRRRADGESFAELARSLTARAIPTPRGGREWQPNSIASMLERRVYLGEVHHGELSRSDAHPSLIDPATWQRAQHPVERSRGRRHAEPALLRGLLRCAGCRRPLTTFVRRRGTQHQHRYYLCVRRSTAGQCPAPANISDASVEPYLEATFWALASRGDGRNGGARRIGRLEEQVAKREGQLAAYRDSPRLPTTLGQERFTAGLAVRTSRVEEALLELDAARRADTAALPDLEQVRAAWPSMGLDERRQLIASRIDCAFVARDRRADDRIFVCPTGTAPPDLPLTKPQIAPPQRSFSPGQAAGRATPPAGWDQPSRAALRATLDPFLSARSAWPSFPEFQAAGLGVAFAAMKRLGRPQRWAKEWDLRYQQLVQRAAGWSEERVRAELGEVLAGRRTWPTHEEFRAAGKGCLPAAARRLGGRDYWAREFGVQISARTQSCCRRWTPERIEVALQELTAGRSDWPPKREFVKAGQLGLYEAIGRAGSRPALARKLGLHLADRQRIRGSTGASRG